jgi:thymidylate synthase (FAD)
MTTHVDRPETSPVGDGPEPTRSPTIGEGDRVELLDHGFVRLDASMADDLSVANAARVSFARRKEELDDSDRGLIRFLMRDRHGTPFEHNSFRFHIRCPIFVAREWMRHRIGCLTGETVVTFVDTNGHATPLLAKSLDALWQSWAEGERDGHAVDEGTASRIRELAAMGISQRAIASDTAAGRRSVRSVVEGKAGRRDGRWRIRGMKLRVLDESTNEFTVGHVDDIVDKGVQPVYRVTLADGKALTLTENHRVLTDEGWRTMREALGLVGERQNARKTRTVRMIVNGRPAHQDREWLQARRAEGKSVAAIAAEAGCSYHTVRKWLAVHDLRFTREERYRPRVPCNKGKRGYRTSLRHTAEHREAIRQARSGPRSNFWRGGVTPDRASIAAWATTKAASVHAQYQYTCQSCGAEGGRLHAHHIVPVWADASRARDIGNLITVCHGCHRRIHRTQESEQAFAREHTQHLGFALDQPAPDRRGWKLTGHPVEVVAVDFVGMRQTYDLCIDGPWHNFVANGVVVHNSFNEFSLRYAKATDDFYVPDLEDVRSQVGKPGAYTFEPVDDELAVRTREELRKVYDVAYETYESLVEAGVARELARSVLPVGAYTEFYWTVNARSLMNFVSLRAAETAQREIRRYALAVEAFLAREMPVTYAAFIANERSAP